MSAARTPGTPAFVHVDLDDLWALADCYGFDAPADIAHFISADALPRLARLFDAAGVRATFFVVGRDALHPPAAAALRGLLADGHAVANHSMDHPLTFRNLPPAELERQVADAEVAIAANITGGVRPVGFRAPGYGVSPALLRVLAARGYAYDCSAMPGPWGGAFRLMDARMRATTARGRAVPKAQFGRMIDMVRHPLRPHRPVPGSPLLEIPSATSPLLRLPFQAGVCMRLGPGYAAAQLAAFRGRPDIPLLLLLHGADVADFAALGHPFFRRHRFFSGDVAAKEQAMATLLRAVTADRPVTTTEAWIAAGGGAE